MPKQVPNSRISFAPDVSHQAANALACRFLFKLFLAICAVVETGGTRHGIIRDDPAPASWFEREDESRSNNAR